MKTKTLSILLLDNQKRLDALILGGLAKHLQKSTVITESLIFNEISSSGKKQNLAEDYLWALNVVSRAIQWDMIFLPYKKGFEYKIIEQFPIAIRDKIFLIIPDKDYHYELMGYYITRYVTKILKESDGYSSLKKHLDSIHRRF